MEEKDRADEIIEFFETLIQLFNEYNVAASFDFYWDDRNEDDELVKLTAHANIPSTYFHPDGKLKFGQGILN